MFQSEVTDVVKEGFYDFSFKFHDKKQSFQATKSSERDGWLAAINNAVTEASGAKENLRGTDGYKSNYKKYMLTSGVAGVGAGAVGAAAIAKDVKNDDKVHNGTIAPTTTAAAGTTTTKKSTSRSRSRGPLGLFRQTKEKTEANIVHAKEEAGIKKEEKPEEKKAEEVALIGPGMLFYKISFIYSNTNILFLGSTAAVVPATHAKDTVDTAKTPLKEKRTSRFGSAGNIFGSSKKSTDVKPTTEPVAAEAPKVDSPVESGASLTESVPTQAATTTTHAPVVESAPVASEPAVVAAATAPAATTSEPKKSTEKSPSRGIRGFFAKKEAQGEKKIEEKKIEKEEKKAVESTTESTPIVGGIGKTPFAQAAIPTAVAATAAGAAGAATAATSTATNTATATTNAATAATDATTATTEAVITKPVVDSIATGSGTATGAITNAGTTKKEERRRSIFDTFKSKPKPVSDTKETTSETTSPAGVDESKEKKMFNLFRSSSKKASHEPTSSTAGAPPVPAKDAEVPTATTTTAEATAAKAETPIATETKPEVSSIATEVPTEHAAITSATPVHPTAA